MIIFGLLQALVVMWSYQGGRGVCVCVCGGGWVLLTEFKSHSENLANIKKDCP